jgi:hypothetical protein
VLETGRDENQDADDAETAGDADAFKQKGG